jgi:hypothetical protein
MPEEGFTAEELHVGMSMPGPAIRRWKLMPPSQRSTRQFGGYRHSQGSKPATARGLRIRFPERKPYHL